MKYSKDLNWLSAPAFFLILGILALNSKKQNTHSRQPDKLKVEISAISAAKPS
jgi:hypothetical protein